MTKQYVIIDVEKLESLLDDTEDSNVGLVLKLMNGVLKSMIEENKIDLSDMYYICSYKPLVDRMYENGAYPSYVFQSFVNFYGLYELVNRKETY